MAVTRVASVADAVDLAEQLKRRGEYDWFRGQNRDWRPMRSSLARCEGDSLNEAQERIGRFWSWVSSVPELKTLADDKDQFFAVAQHYRIPTNYVDFTTEPRVAGFFAAHQAKPSSGPTDLACILCLNTNELAEFWEGIALTHPELPDPRRVTVNVPELWRLQAQRGCFLFLPYADFDDRIFNFDRICFPAAETAFDVIPEHDIYPPQKSDLEILLDQYFMLERMQPLDDDNLFPIQVQGHADGIEAECFTPRGLPEHSSWRGDMLEQWRLPAAESWTELSKAPKVDLQRNSQLSLPEQVAQMGNRLNTLMAERKDLRKGPVRWSINGAADGADAMSLYWDGVRRWPFHDQDVAHGLAVTAAFAALVADTPGAANMPDLALELAEPLLGPATEVEVGMTDGSYTRGFAGRSELYDAVRPDFHEFLTDRWRPQITTITHVMQVASAPRRTFVFEKLARVFVRHIVPTQVALRGEATGKARLYNPARAMSLGLP